VPEKPKNPYRILLVNFHSTMNAGDLALLITTRDFLLKIFPQSEIWVSANWPNEAAYSEYGFKVLPSPWSLSGLNSEIPASKQIINFLRTIRKLRNTNANFDYGDLEIDQLRKAYREADLVISVPGNQFYSSGKYGWPFPVSISGAMLAHRYKKPLIILPQSLGPLKRWWERFLIKRAFGKAKIVFLRDEASLKLAKDIGLPKEIINYSPDLALELIPEEEHKAVEVLKNAGFDFDKSSVGLTLISKMNRSFDSLEMQNYYNVVQESLVQFSQNHDLQVVFFNQVCGPTSVENDGIVTEKMAKELIGHGVNVIHINTQLSPQMLKACYGQMDVFIATRLHSGIFALGMAVPTVLIGYLTKTKGVAKSLNLEEDFIDIPNLTQEKLLEKLETIWKARDAKQVQIKEILRKASWDIEKAADKLKEDFGHE